MPDLSTTIATAAAGPRQVSAGGVEAQSQPLPDLIAADKYLAGKAGASGPRRGIRITKLILPEQIGSVTGGTV